MWQKGKLSRQVTLNASDYRANGLLSDYIGWTNGLSHYRANELGLWLGVRYSPFVRCIIKCDPFQDPFQPLMPEIVVHPIWTVTGLFFILWCLCHCFYVIDFRRFIPFRLDHYV